MVPYTSFRPFYPPRACGNTRIADAGTFIGWGAQYKFNGVHVMIFCSPSGQLELRTRKCEPLRGYQMPDAMRSVLQALVPRGSWSVLDGELLHTKAKTVKNTVVIFDALVLDGWALLDTTVAERQRRLVELCNPGRLENVTGRQLARVVDDPVWLAETFMRGWSEMYMKAVASRDRLIEGLMLKDPNGPLAPGNRRENNHHWMARVKIVSP